MDVKGFVFCQQHSSTSHDYSADSQSEDRAKKVQDKKRKRVGYEKKAVREIGEKSEEKKKKNKENTVCRFNRWKRSGGCRRDGLKKEI